MRRREVRRMTFRNSSGRSAYGKEMKLLTDCIAHGSWQMEEDWTTCHSHCRVIIIETRSNQTYYSLMVNSSVTRWILFLLVASESSIIGSTILPFYQDFIMLFPAGNCPISRAIVHFYRSIPLHSDNSWLISRKYLLVAPYSSHHARHPETNVNNQHRLFDRLKLHRLIAGQSTQSARFFNRFIDATLGSKSWRSNITDWGNSIKNCEENASVGKRNDAMAMIEDGDDEDNNIVTLEKSYRDKWSDNCAIISH